MTVSVCSQNSNILKEEGNKAYKAGDWETALSKYTSALNIADNSAEKLALYKNRAAVNLKTESYDDVVKDCDYALEISPNDAKALYRRSLAYEAKELYEKAYADARSVLNVDSKNKDVQILLSRLHHIVQDLVVKNSQISSKVSQVFEVLFDTSAELGKRETCANNLVALAKESAGAKLLIEQNVLGRMLQLLNAEKSKDIRLGCIRTLSELSLDLARAKKILPEVGLPWLLDLMNNADEALVTAAQYCFQCLLNTLSGSDFKTETKPDRNLMQENEKEIDSVMAVLTRSLTNRTLTAICRDAVIELILKNLDYKVLNWGDKFIRIGGVQKLLEIASELQEYHYESAIDITENTQMTTSICLSKVYETQYDEKTRAKFVQLVDDYVKEHLAYPDVEVKVRVTVMITTLLLGPLDVGNTFIAREGVLEMLLVMANSDDELQQRVSCEALIAAASKKDKCRSIMTDGTDILKRLYESKNVGIKVRALVGLCKLGSLGGTDATMRPFAEGASLKLAEACRRFLVNPTKDKDMRRWACEGLSYLTLDAEVKEKLIEDKHALRSMIELAKSGHMNCLYGVVTTFVNLCNAYDKQEVLPEMVELAKFAKQHIPEEHELDDKDFIDKRVSILAEEGASAALAALSKTESLNSKELIARIFNAICEMQKNRGLVVQQGGTKALINLALEGTEKGKRCASQALSRIAITIDPEVAFPGQRIYEVVRPLLNLLDINCSGLENFEALMGLCNIAGASESARQRIILECGVTKIEHYLFEYHEMIRRAAFQCMANMCASPEIVKLHEKENDKLKYMVLATSDEDEEIIKAAGGALCMMLGESVTLCKKVFSQVKDWEEILKFLLSHGKPDIQYRGTVIVYLLSACEKSMCEKIIDTHCKDALQAIVKIENPELVYPKAREYAYKTLKLAADYKFIKDPDSTDQD